MKEKKIITKNSIYFCGAAELFDVFWLVDI